MVEGYLLPNESKLLLVIGVIVKEWCDWIPILNFVPLYPLWIWVMYLRWRSICKHLFPNCILIDGAGVSLPAMDILLMSRISLHACAIDLKSIVQSMLIGRN